MGWVTIIAMFLIIWWLTLFAVLPWGVRGQAEEDSVVDGTETGAPVDSRMWRKIGITTLIATALTFLFWLTVTQGWADWRKWPWLPDLPEGYSDGIG